MESFDQPKSEVLLSTQMSKCFHQPKTITHLHQPKWSILYQPRYLNVSVNKITSSSRNEEARESIKETVRWHCKITQKIKKVLPGSIPIPVSEYHKQMKRECWFKLNKKHVQKKGVFQLDLLDIQDTKSTHAVALLLKSATCLSVQPSTYKAKLTVEDWKLQKSPNS